MIDKILGWFGLQRKQVYEPLDEYLFSINEPYCRNGVWYNIYDDITEDTLEDKTKLKEDWEITSRLTPTEIARYNKFIENHKHTEDNRYFEGPKHWIGFGSGGGIGKCVYVKCEHCGRIYDITDNSAW